MSAEGVTNNEQDLGTQTIEKYLGEMEIGEKRVLNVDDFETLMRAIHSDFDRTKNNSGAIESGTGEVYEYFDERDRDAGGIVIVRVESYETKSVIEGHEDELREMAKQILLKYPPIVLDIQKNLNADHEQEMATYEKAVKAALSRKAAGGHLSYPDLPKRRYAEDVVSPVSSKGPFSSVEEHNNRHNAHSEYFDFDQLPPVELLPVEMSEEDKLDYEEILKGLTELREKHLPHKRMGE